MKIIVKSGDTIIEYQEETGLTTYPELTYNSGTSSNSNFYKNELILKTIRNMADICIDIEKQKYID